MNCADMIANTATGTSLEPVRDALYDCFMLRFYLRCMIQRYSDLARMNGFTEEFIFDITGKEMAFLNDVELNRPEPNNK